MGRNLIETLMGAVVIAVAVFFFVFAYNTANIKTVKGYEVTARFDRIDGIRQGSDVRMSGIKIGSVLDSRLDPTTYLAVVRFNISQSIQIPKDSSVRVLSDGLLGDAYLSIEPGSSDTMLEPGAAITRTQDSINIVDLLGRFAFSGAEDSGTGGGLE